MLKINNNVTIKKINNRDSSAMTSSALGSIEIHNTGF